jgi:hypothetical protein
MPWVGFEPTIPTFDRAKAVYILDCTATVIGCYLHKKLRGFESASELYRSSDRRRSAKLGANLADRGCHVVSATSPSDRNFDFLDLEPLLFLHRHIKCPFGIFCWFRGLDTILLNWSVSTFSACKFWKGKPSLKSSRTKSRFMKNANCTSCIHIAVLSVLKQQTRQTKSNAARHPWPSCLLSCNVLTFEKFVAMATQNGVIFKAFTYQTFMCT